MLCDLVFEVADVQRPLLSVSKLLEQGYELKMSRGVSQLILPSGERLPLRRQRGPRAKTLMSLSSTF